ncbi:MAG: hypothetical protein ACLPZF_14520, partial [Candidatus Acidiferrales bacterium]
MLIGPAHSRFRKKLLAWFAEFQRDLPWRRTKDPYRIWLSEIMLQQTRVAAAIPYYERFLERFPDVGALADAPEEEVLRHWAGLVRYWQNKGDFGSSLCGTASTGDYQAIEHALRDALGPALRPIFPDRCVGCGVPDPGYSLRLGAMEGRWRLLAGRILG